MQRTSGVCLRRRQVGRAFTALDAKDWLAKTRHNIEHVFIELIREVRQAKKAKEQRLKKEGKRAAKRNRTHSLRRLKAKIKAKKECTLF